MKNAWLLSDPEKKPLTIAVGAKALVIDVPAKAPDAVDTVIAVEL